MLQSFSRPLAGAGFGHRRPVDGRGSRCPNSRFWVPEPHLGSLTSINQCSCIGFIGLRCFMLAEAPLPLQRRDRSRPVCWINTSPSHPAWRQLLLRAFFPLFLALLLCIVGENTDSRTLRAHKTSERPRRQPLGSAGTPRPPQPPRQTREDEMPQPDISGVKYGSGSNPIELDGNLGWGEERRRQ